MPALAYPEERMNRPIFQINTVFSVVIMIRVRF